MKKEECRMKNLESSLCNAYSSARLSAFFILPSAFLYGFAFGNCGRVLTSTPGTNFQHSTFNFERRILESRALVRVCNASIILFERSAAFTAFTPLHRLYSRRVLSNLAALLKSDG